MEQTSSHFKKNHSLNFATRVALFLVAVFMIGVVLVLCVQLTLVNHRMAAMEETFEGLRRVEERNANISDNEVAAKHEMRIRGKRSNFPDVEKRLQALEQRIFNSTESGSSSPLLRGRDGRDGSPGSPGQQGVQGRDGRDGREGPSGPRGLRGQKGDAGKTGSTGPQGPPGLQGETGPEGQGLSGVKYVHWGRRNCSGDATVVYSGIIGGDHYTHPGGASNYLCLPNNPIYGSYADGWNGWAAIYGTEYEVSGFNGFKNNLHNHEAPCAVCHVKSRGSQLMIPARNVCPSGWTREYHGYLMTAHYNHKHSSEYVCVDVNAEAVPGTQPGVDGALLYVVQGSCGALPCLPYVNGQELTCAVCTK